MMIIPLALIGFGIYYLLNHQNLLNHNVQNTSQVEDTLKLRYVNGEIDEETYRKMMNLIKN